MPINLPDNNQNAQNYNELLILLEYLKNNCYGEENKISQTKFLDYAKSKYGVIIRRDKLPIILDQLYSIQNLGAKLLPFKINRKAKKAGYNYYVSGAVINDDDIIHIGSAISNSPIISKSDADALLDEFLNNICPGQSTDKFKKKIGELDLSIIENEDSELVNNFGQCINNQSLVKILFRDYVLTYYRNNNPLSLPGLFRELINKIEKRGELSSFESNRQITCYILKIIRKEGNIFDVVAYSTIDDYIFVFPLKYVESYQECIDMTPRIVINQDKAKNFNDWLKKYSTGKTGKLYTIKFKFRCNEETKKLQTYAQYSFKKVFGEPINKCCKRKEKSNEGIDLYFEIRCNLDKFAEWYYDRNFEFVVITEPGILNDYFLEDFIDVFAKRLTNYGKRFEYDIVKKPK